MAEEARRARGERLALLLRTPSVVLGAVVVAFWVVCAILGNRITPYDPIFDHTGDQFVGPSSEHWFGTDRLGRDIFSRVIAGSRDILLVAPLATLLATVIGTTLGLVTGYLRRADDVVSRLLEAFLALPLVVIAITAITAVGTRSQWVVSVVIALVFSAPLSRTVRAAVLQEASLDYVEAARLRGENAFYIMGKEILPN
ncbi:MAG: ABC transporter permease, partial [Thermoleophilia bacterium]|nr:ABC transporter permease [Thermoleophilia bacterium]